MPRRDALEGSRHGATWMEPASVVVCSSFARDLTRTSRDNGSRIIECFGVAWEGRPFWIAPTL